MQRTTREDDNAVNGVFPGDGEMAALCRAFDWGVTSLGRVEEWPAELRTVVRSVLESPFAIGLWCGPEHVLIYNDRYRQVLGAKHPTALGMPGAEVWDDVWPDVADAYEAIRGGGPTLFAEDVHFEIERPAEVGGGHADAWMTFALSPVRDDAGEVIAILHIVSETTKRIQAERGADRLVDAIELERSRLEYVFRHAPAFLAVARGANYVFELANDAYYQLVGHRPLIGKALFDAMPELRGQHFGAILDRVYATGEPFIGREVLVQVQRTPGGPLEERFCDLTYLPLIESGNTPSGIIAHGIDVTEHVLARREVERLLGESERARAEADAANRTKSEFLATMSHEFRTPLNAILGYAQLLDMGVLGPATPAQQAHLDRLRASARHLLRIVDDVLDVAKVDADRLDVRRDPLVTEAAIASAVALIQPQATAKGIRLFNLGADAPGVRYIGDEHRVRQILVNLLSNAVKFTPHGGEVTVSCGLTAHPPTGTQLGSAADEGDEPTAWVEGGSCLWAFVEVKDTGPGVAPELVSRMFEPFVQGDSALTRQQGGTGLGLTISRRLARLMGGDLTVRNRSSAGAVFTLWLPGAPGQVVPPPVERPTHRTPVSVPVFLSKETGVQNGMLDEAAYAVLHALGVRLAGDAETVAERYVAALRADGRFPGGNELPAVQLRNHATPVIGLLATQLMIIGETRGQAPELLGDGGQVMRLMDELHGAQRHRLGWSEADIERETPILQGELERAIRSAVDTAAVDDAVKALGAGNDVSDSETTRRAVSLASQYALDVARHVLERGTRTSLRAFRFARAAEAH